jgi:hypothetical protein
MLLSGQSVLSGPDRAGQNMLLSGQSVLSGPDRAGQTMLSGQSVQSVLSGTAGQITRIRLTNRASRATRALGCLEREGAAIPAQATWPGQALCCTGCTDRPAGCWLAVSAVSATRCSARPDIELCAALSVLSVLSGPGEADAPTCTCVPIRAVRAVVRPPGLRTHQPWFWCSAAVRAVSACNWCGTPIRDPDSALTDSVSMTEVELELLSGGPSTTSAAKRHSGSAIGLLNPGIRHSRRVAARAAAWVGAGGSGE